MRAISLWQPWASAVANGVKRIETRHWRTWYHSPIAIHAAKRKTHAMGHQFRDLFRIEAIYNAFLLSDEDCWNLLPFGAVVATAVLQDCVPTDMITKSTLSPTELALGDYSTGRYAWILTDIKKLPKPIPAVGRRGLFNV